MSGSSPTTAAVPERGTKQALWDAFCAAHDIAAMGVPLLAADPDGVVEVSSHGRDGRPMLQRSAAMEDLLTGTVGQVLAAQHGEAEGVLLIGVASLLFPDDLLDDEGVNRTAVVTNGLVKENRATLVTAR